MISAAIRSASSSSSRRRSSKARSCSSNSGALAFRLTGMTGRLSDLLDERLQRLGSGLQRGAVDDETGRNLGDDFNLGQIVGAQRRTAGDQIDNPLAEGEGRCQLDRTGEPDALRAHATPREMPAG